MSLTAVSGSLYFSEVVGYIPCELCWWQRIFMYPIFLLSFVSLFNKSDGYVKYILPLSGIGMFISIYHVYVQFNGVDTGFCSSGVSCSIKYIEWFGFITIPVLCLIAFIIINVTLLLKVYLKLRK